MRFQPLPIAGVFQIEIDQETDARGFFARTFCADEFCAHGLETNFPQRSISFNRERGTLRGLHFQAAPHSETKIVRCNRGASFNVIVDLRRTSANYRSWHGVKLTADGREMIYVPAGCAHGFQTLADDTELYYEITPAYEPHARRGIRWNDPDLAIRWPLPISAISERDQALPSLAECIGADTYEPRRPA